MLTKVCEGPRAPAAIEMLLPSTSGNSELNNDFYVPWGFPGEHSLAAAAVGIQRLSHGNKTSIANSSQELRLPMGSKKRRQEQDGKKHLLICTGWENRHSLVSAAEEQG